jgi:alpha-methylacyl-CoA racemase
MNRAKWPVFRDRFAAIFKSKTRAAWDRQLLDKGLCYTPVLSFEEAQQFPHNQARGTFVKSGSFTQAAPAPRFSRTTLAAPRPGAAMGTHTDSILRAAGLSTVRIQELQRSGVVA